MRGPGAGVQERPTQWTVLETEKNYRVPRWEANIPERTARLLKPDIAWNAHKMETTHLLEQSLQGGGEGGEKRDKLREKTGRDVNEGRGKVLGIGAHMQHQPSSGNLSHGT